MMIAKKRMATARVLLAIVLALTFFGSQAVSMAQSPTTAKTVQTFELVGTVESKTSTTITVNTQVINIANAQINTPLTVGAVVKVEGFVNANDSLIAREVNAPAPTDVLTDEAEIVGTLTAINGTMMTIAGQDFDTSHAEIKAGVKVGATVKVHASLVNGVWIAREVAVTADITVDNNTPLGEFELTGTLTALDETTATVAGQTIDISQAEVKGSLVVGALVKVHVSMVNGQLVAREIELALATNNQGGDDNGGDDINDDNGGHEINDDNGNDNGGHDINDDNGGHDVGDDNGNSGQNGGGDNQGGNHGGDDGGNHGGGDDHGGSGHG